MQIHHEQPESLKVELTAAELMRFGLTYELLNYEEKRTKAMLDAVLKGGCAVTGFAGQKNKLLIEVFPAPKKGCVIYFTALSDQPGEEHRPAPHVYTFESSEAMISAIQSLPTDAAPAKSELYEMDGRYLLILHGDGPLSLLEYGAALPADRLNVAAIREHGRLLASPDAVQSIQKAVENE